MRIIIAVMNSFTGRASNVRIENLQFNADAMNDMIAIEEELPHADDLLECARK